MMKSIITILLIIIAFSCKAQSPIIDLANYKTEDVIDGCYLKDIQNKFTPFIGTWKWSNSNDTLIIKIKKVEKVYEDLDNYYKILGIDAKNIKKYYEDLLIGQYNYIKNGSEIINTLNYNITKDNVWTDHPDYPKAGYVPMQGGYQSDKVAKFSFRDYLKNKSEKASFELLPNTFVNGVVVKTVRLRLWNTEHWNINGQNPRDPEFTIPTDIILTKQ